MGKRSKTSLWANLTVPNYQKDLWSRRQSSWQSTEPSWNCDGYLPKGRRAGSQDGALQELEVRVTLGLLYLTVVGRPTLGWFTSCGIFFSEGCLHAKVSPWVHYCNHHLHIRGPQPWTEEVASDRCCLPQLGGQAEPGR